MVEETGKVVAVEGKKVWVETQVKSTCGSCKAEESCPTSSVAKAFTPKKELLVIEAPCVLVVGQQVKIGIDESALLIASAMTYIVPLLAMMLTAASVMFLFEGIHELLALFISCFAALGGFWWASAFAKKPHNLAKFTPVFLGATHSEVRTYKHEIPTHKLDNH